MEKIQGGITAARGFRAAGVCAGVKKEGVDLALIVSDTDAVSAGVFTTNVVQAAPVLVSKRIIREREHARAIVVNSGNANACTGEKGMQDANRMCMAVADQFACEADDVLVASTGVIGVPLAIDKVETGINAATPELGRGHAFDDAAARAIMTTDTRTKTAAVKVVIDGRDVHIGGMAKGSGMIHPNMATMLAFLTTDACVDAKTLRTLVSSVTDDTFNMISVDGDTSTNDTVFVLANGCAENRMITPDHPDFDTFAQALTYVLESLSKQIVRDGEGASKFLEVRVSGAKSVEDARKLVKSAIGSSLVKTAFFGADANWGRILVAMGYSGASFSPERVSIDFLSDGGRILLMRDGEPIVFDEDVAKKVLEETDIHVDIRLQEGEYTATGWGCDLSYEYVRINGDYRT